MEIFNTSIKQLTIDVFQMSTSLKVYINLSVSLTVGFISYFEKLYLSSEQAISSILVLLVVDWFFGVANALNTVNKDGKSMFKTGKSLKIIVYMISYAMLIVMLTNLEQSFSFLGWLVEAVMIPIILGHIISILKNMALLGIITNAQFKDILKRIDGHKDEAVTNHLNETTEDGVQNA